MGSLYMTIQTAVLIETLVELGADGDGAPVISFRLKIMLQLLGRGYSGIRLKVKPRRCGIVLGMHSHG